MFQIPDFQPDPVWGIRISKQEWGWEVFVKEDIDFTCLGMVVKLQASFVFA